MAGRTTCWMLRSRAVTAKARLAAGDHVDACGWLRIAHHASRNALRPDAAEAFESARRAVIRRRYDQADERLAEGPAVAP